MAGETQIYDARTGTYIRGGASSRDPGGDTVYHVTHNGAGNASSFKDPNNIKSVVYPSGNSAVSQANAPYPLASGISSNAIQTYLAPTYVNDYSALADSFLQSFGNLDSTFSDMIDAQYRLSERNSALSQEMADKANAFNADQANISRSWSAEQAKINRDWQTEMSNSAHQREVADLISAGLNPILSANTGASTPSGGVPSASNASGHMGQVDTTSAVGIGSQLMSSALNAAVQLESINAQKEMQRYNIDNQLYMQQKSIEAELERTALSGQYGVEQAEQGKLGSFAIAGASKYASDNNYNLGQAEIRNKRDMQEAEFAHNLDLQSSKYGFESDLVDQQYRNQLYLTKLGLGSSERIARWQMQNQDRMNRRTNEFNYRIGKEHNDTSSYNTVNSGIFGLTGDALRLGSAIAIGGLVGRKGSGQLFGM